MNEHQKRLITAFAGLAVVFTIYFTLHQTGLIWLSAIISMVAYFEFLTILLEKSSLFQWKRWSAVVLGGFLFANPYVAWNFVPTYFYLLTFLATALYASHNSDDNNALRANLKDALVQCFGLFYIVGFLSFVPMLNALPNGPALLLLLLLIIWGGDSAAYYAGKKFGRRKLSPRLSPGKSVEGGIAAVIFSCCAAAVLHFAALPVLNLPILVLVGGLTSIVAQAGDLLESLMKRAAEVKDSGNLFPGHGGVFDRFDSLILAAPFFFFVVQVFLV